METISALPLKHPFLLYLKYELEYLKSQEIISKGDVVKINISFFTNLRR